MPRKSISSIELAAIINELQFITRGKLSQIYHRGNEFLLQVHAPGRGKQFLKVLPGKWICLSSLKGTFLSPSGFCMQLRKYIANATINRLYQKDAERIIVFDLEKEKKYALVVEFFGRGNLLLIDENATIITAFDRLLSKSRTIRPGEHYLFPSQMVNWKTITEHELRAILQRSEKKNLATSLATELGLGGVYAEELCRRAGIDKDQLPREVTSYRTLLNALKDVRHLLETPKGYVYGDEITPIPLKDKPPLRITKTYTEALAVADLSSKESPYKKKITILQRTIQEQEEAIRHLEEENTRATARAGLIYEHYVFLQNLLRYAREARKTKKWPEIGDELKNEPKVTAVDLKTKKITVDL